MVMLILLYFPDNFLSSTTIFAPSFKYGTMSMLQSITNENTFKGVKYTTVEVDNLKGTLKSANRTYLKLTV
jgi:hypothetical protein